MATTVATTVASTRWHYTHAVFCFQICMCTFFCGRWLWIWCQPSSCIPASKPQRPGHESVHCSVHTSYLFFVQCPFSSYFFGQVQPRQVNQMLQDYLVFSLYLFSIVRYTSHISLPGPPRDQRSGLGKGQAKGLGKGQAKGLEKGQTKGLEKGQNQQSSSTSSSNSGQSSPSPPPGKGRGGPKGARPKNKGRPEPKAAPEVKEEEGSWVEVARKGNRRKN